MAMFWEFFRFELRFRLKSISTYVYLLLWGAFAFLCVASESFGPVGSRNGKILLNGPWAIHVNDIGSVFFGTIVIAAIFGTAILRDFQRDTYQLLFTKPISKFAYLGGRWAGSLVTSLFVFLGMPLGMMLGSLAPWADHTRLTHASLFWYVMPYFTVIAVQTFFLGSLFFAVAALTRRIFIVYLQGVALFLVYIVGLTIHDATRSLERFWSTIFDPIGLLALNNITGYWTVAERNSLMVPLTGPWLYNRLLWSAVGLVSLATVWALFPMSVEALTARSQGRRAAKQRQQDQAEAAPARSLVVARIPLVRPVFGRGTAWAQFRTLTRIRVRSVLQEIPFWAILVLTAGLAITNGFYAGKVGDSRVFPVTYLMLGVVEGNASLFGLIVVGLYAAELLWRERDTRFDGIHDAMPLTEAADWWSRVATLAFVSLMVLLVTFICCVLCQTVQGFYHYDLLQYFQELLLIVFPQIMMYGLLALFVQTLVPNKFLGHGIVIACFVLQPIIFNFGLENTLYLYGSTPTYTFSDMNRYGHFVPAILWSTVYWAAIAGLLGVLSLVLARRGAETSLGSRLRQARSQAPRYAVATVVLLLVAVGSGAWYWYNSHVLNEYLNAKDRRHIQAEYERAYKRYERQPQPKITAIDTVINIYPERRSFDGTAHFLMQNKSGIPLNEIHITDQHESITDIQFSRPTQLVSSGPRHAYSIYRFAQPLAPGETFEMNAHVEHISRGFRDGNEMAQFAYNGTFFDTEFLPQIGYQNGIELDDPRRRREERLGPFEEMRPIGDPEDSRLNLFSGQQADWITYHTVVSTSADQIALSPGYLQRKWTQGGRNYYEYSMGATHIQAFLSWISGRYAVRSVPYKGVNVEVYYDPLHPYDVEKMIEAAERGLDYDSVYSPFQFTQYRVIEFPRYRSFAQSFPNTIPFSESLGFIGRVTSPKDIDFAYFVTAHELGHQWWGHQLIGGRVQGSNMMSESFAEYSALRIMAHRYGEQNMRLFLKHELDGYLRGRSGEVRHEPPLGLVQNEPYVWYQKGSVILYAISDYIGEDRLNQALGKFLRENRYANANNQVDAASAPQTSKLSARMGGRKAGAIVSDDLLHPVALTSVPTGGVVGSNQPYPDTRLLEAALREATPPEFQYFITDSFERIVLYDNKAVKATSRRLPSGKFEVTLDVQARKLQADGNGQEQPVPINDLLDIGVFSGTPDQEKVLSLRKERITNEHQSFRIVVDEQPLRAGIDPYNKLIDRRSDDNVVDVTR